MRELIMQVRHVTYRETEKILDTNGTSKHSMLHKHLTVKKFIRVGSYTICRSLEKKARKDCLKEMLKKYDRCTVKYVLNKVMSDKS